MSAASDYLEGELRKHLFRTGTFTKPSTLAICLLTSAPSDSSTGSTIVEPNNSHGYSRQALNPDDANWTAASSTNGLTDNASLVSFGPCTTSDWGSVTHFAICDSATYGAGNMLIHGALDNARTIQVGDYFQFAIGELNVVIA